MDKMKRKHMPRSAGNVLFLRAKRGKFISAHSISESVYRLRKMQNGNWLWGPRTRVRVDWIDKDTCSFRVCRIGKNHPAVEVLGQLSCYQDMETFVEYRARLTHGTYLLLAVNVLYAALFSIATIWIPFLIAFWAVLGLNYLSTLLTRNRLARDVENALMKWGEQWRK